MKCPTCGTDDWFFLGSDLHGGRRRQSCCECGTVTDSGMVIHTPRRSQPVEAVEWPTEEDWWWDLDNEAVFWVHLPAGGPPHRVMEGTYHYRLPKGCYARATIPVVQPREPMHENLQVQVAELRQMARHDSRFGNRERLMFEAIAARLEREGK